jgi:hypothetical protein
VLEMPIRSDLDLYARSGSGHFDRIRILFQKVNNVQDDVIESLYMMIQLFDGLKAKKGVHLYSMI